MSSESQASGLVSTYSEYILYVFFCDLVISLRIIFSSSVHVPKNFMNLCSFYHNCSVGDLEVRNGDSTRSSFIVENSFQYPGFFVIPDELPNSTF